MAKEFSKAFYCSAAWRKCRQAYIDYRVSVDGGLCECCHNELGYIVHHKIKLTMDNINDDSITLSFDNLAYECKACHDREDGHFVKTKDNLRRALFSGDGQVLPPIKN